ncbi:MAG: peptidoglycan editing factor PgeF [Syntrophobacterales bacterium]|jgi:YfiH family protein|nr:peptidoglycan editing factor PgeF [Syntrophobacterales bacterium]
MADYRIREKAGWSYYCLPELEKRGVTHGFFTKLSPSHRMEGVERREFLEAFSLKDLVIMSQEHGDHVHVIDGEQRPAVGDGIVVLKRGIAAIIKTADCLPVILAEPEYPVAAIVHAGWRGTAKRIVGKAARRLMDLGVNPKKIIAVLGPAIGACCYEVQKDVQDIFIAEGFSPCAIRQADGSVTLNIKEANKTTLKDEGIEQIHNMDFCTFCSGNLFHSYRRGEKDRRQINFVSLQ